MRMLIVVITCWTLAGFAVATAAANPADASVRQADAGADEAAGRGVGRPTTGLVLSGGGARGLAHVGVLRVLERNRVPIDAIAGTSMGALVGGLYACGYTPDEIDTVLRHTDWTGLFRDKPDRRRKSYRRKEDDNLGLFPFELGITRQGLTAKAGLIDGNRIDFLLRKLTLGRAEIDDFDRLPIPYRAVATDLRNGDTVVLRGGDLPRAMRASMAVPAVFTPVELDGRILIDGGISQNLPVDVARQMGVDRILAVDVGTAPDSDLTDISALGVLNQSFMLLQQIGIDEQIASLTQQDLLIRPELEEFTSADFARAPEALRLGELAAEALEDRLREFAVSVEDYARFEQRRREGFALEPPTVQIVETEIRGVGRTDPRVLQHRMRTESGKPLDLDLLARDLERMDQAGEYDSVRFSLEGPTDAAKLVVDAQESIRGANRLRFGFTAESNLAGDSDFQALALHRRSEIGRWGAEWKTTVGLGRPTSIETEYYQPLGIRGYGFFEARASFSREKTVQFLESGDRERIKERRREAELDFGIQLQNLGEIRLGYLRGRSELNPDTATLFPAEERELGGARFRFTLDRLDDVYFPSIGNSTVVDLFVSRESLGADDRFERLDVQSFHAWTRGRNTFVGGVELGTNLGSDLPFAEQFALGGFLNLSGFRRGQLRGDLKGLLTLVDYWRIGDLGPVGGLYLGAALQGGNVWDDVDAAEFGDLLYSGTLFFGVDTPLTPVYLGYGLAEGGENQVYLFIGRALGR